MYRPHFFAEILGSKWWLLLKYVTICPWVCLTLDQGQVFLQSIQFWCPDFLYTTAWLPCKCSPVMELRLIFVQTSTFSLGLWASTMKTTVVSPKNLRNGLRQCF